MLFCYRQRLTAVALVVLLAVNLSCGGFWVDPEVVSISVTPPSPSLLSGLTQQFTASATFDDGDIKVLSSPAWTSSNSLVVFINPSGVATAVAQGSATISASSGGIAGSTTVTVVTSPLTALAVTPTNPTVNSSQGTLQFSASGTFGDGTVRDITNGVAWSSSNTEIATINAIGTATITGKQGTATIQASSGNIAGTTTLTVIQ